MKTLTHIELQAADCADNAQPATPTTDAARNMGAKGGQADEAERLAFEAWMHGHCWRLGGKWDGNSYRGKAETGGFLDPSAMLTRQLWAAWRDRAALAQALEEPATEVQRPQAEPVAWMCEYDEDGEIEREYNTCNEFSCGRTGLPLYAAPPAPIDVDDLMSAAWLKGWMRAREQALHPDRVNNADISGSDHPHQAVAKLLASIHAMRPAYPPGVNDCARSHPHENMSELCKQKSTLARVCAEPLAAAPTPKHEPQESGMVLTDSDVDFLAARVLRLCDWFGHSTPKTESHFVVGVAGSLIGAILTKLEVEQRGRAAGSTRGSA